MRASGLLTMLALSSALVASRASGQSSTAAPTPEPTAASELAVLTLEGVGAAEVTGLPAGDLPAPRRADAYEQVGQPPRREDVFHIRSEAAWRERVRAGGALEGRVVRFPDEAPAGPPGEFRQLPPSTASFVPYVVCYRPLYFEDKNTERYGWRVPLVQPLISTAKFYLDTALVPYKMGVLPPWQCECNSGYALPGDPVPYKLYLPPWSWTGAALEAGAVAGVVAP